MRWGIADWGLGRRRDEGRGVSGEEKFGRDRLEDKSRKAHGRLAMGFGASAQRESNRLACARGSDWGGGFAWGMKKAAQPDGF